MTPRATPMSPEDRRRAILDATLPLLVEHGRRTTTKQIAQAAGIAEGTIFRVFANKDELFDAAITTAFDPSILIAELESIDLHRPLEERLVEMTRRMQRRFQEIFTLLSAMGMARPPGRHEDHNKDHKDHEARDWRRRTVEAMVAVVEPDAAAFRLPPEEVVRMLRLLTFSGSHPHITDNQLMTPDEIVDVVLHGTLRKEP